MEFYNDPIKKREFIMNHYRNPKNRIVDDYGYTAFLFNGNEGSCSDIINLFYKWDGNKFIDLRFKGIGCSIAIASTDIFLEIVKRKKKKEIEEIILLYKDLIKNQKIHQELKDLNVFNNVANHSNRVDCSLIIVNTIAKLLKEI